MRNEYACALCGCEVRTHKDYWLVGKRLLCVRCYDQHGNVNGERFTRTNPRAPRTRQDCAGQTKLFERVYDAREKSKVEHA